MSEESTSSNAGAEATLFERLGGEESIEAVVDDFYERVLDDGRVSHFFQGTDMQEQRAHMTSFLAATAGGPTEYTGQDMAEAHDHLVIRPEQFDAIAELLEETLWSSTSQNRSAQPSWRLSRATRTTS